jgi:Ca2+-binding EF-hand superfamily protein
MVNGVGSLGNLFSSYFQQRIETTFNSSDSDSDGKLNKTEFNSFLISLAGQSGTAPGIDELFASADTDGDGALSLTEVEKAHPEPPADMKAMMGFDQAMAQNRIETDFAKADADGDGVLTETEFETLISNAPTPPDAVEGTEPDTETLFVNADSDSDGYLTLDEVKNAAPQGPPPPMGGGMMAKNDIAAALADLLSSATGDEETSGTVFNYLDTNQDGVVDIDEILAAFSKNAADMYSMTQQAGTVSGNDLDVSA